MASVRYNKQSDAFAAARVGSYPMRMQNILRIVCLAWLAFVSAGEPVFETLRPAGHYA